MVSLSSTDIKHFVLIWDQNLYHSLRRRYYNAYIEPIHVIYITPTYDI